MQNIIINFSRNSDSSCLRNKSPPTKKTKRKENHQQSQLLNCVTSVAANSYNNTHLSIGNAGVNNSNSHPLLHQQPSQPPNRVIFYVVKFYFRLEKKLNRYVPKIIPLHKICVLLLQLTSIANALTQDNPSSYGDKPILERKFLHEGSTAGEQRFSFLGKLLKSKLY